MKRAVLILLFIILIAVDQLSKYLIRSYGGFYICNKNIAFGINIPEIIFWFFWIIIIVALAYYVFKNRFLHTTYCLLLILSGAISNTIDRLYFGCVIDFIDLKFLPRSELVWGWPIFNLADSFIVLGAIILILKTQNTKSQNTNKPQ